MDDLPEGADPHKGQIDALGDILDGVTVPCRKEGLKKAGTGGDASNDDDHLFVLHGITPVLENRDLGETSLTAETGKAAPSLKVFMPKDMLNVPVLYSLTRYDLRRYFVASNCDLKLAAVRIVESAAWRGVTFPIDVQACQLELQSGQFFQQGRDKDGNALFYFKNMGLGPWRKNVDATVFAVVHRLEACMKRLVVENPEVRCTVVVLMGKPIDEREAKFEEREGGETSEGDYNASCAVAGASTNKGRGKHMKRAKQSNLLFAGTNPLIKTDGEYKVHTNFSLVCCLNEVLSRHYPERLAKVLIVPSGGWDKAIGTFGLRAYVPAQRTRDKVIILNSIGDLKKYVDENELVTFAGGTSVVTLDAFSCS